MSPLTSVQTDVFVRLYLLFYYNNKVFMLMSIINHLLYWNRIKQLQTVAVDSVCHSSQSRTWR